MEYICKIISLKQIPRWAHLFWCYRLPIFELEPERIYGIQNGDYLYFYKEDRYTPCLISVSPPKLTEEQLHIINQKWNYYLENNMSELEFEM